MIEGILFLLTSIISARFLEKRKMRVAAVLYDLMFIVLLFVLCFAVDIPLFRAALTNIFGETLYYILHIVSLRIVNESFSGMSVIAFIAFSISVQLGIGIYTLSKKVVCKLIKRAPYSKFSRTYISKIINTIVFYPYNNINRLYCRMLN